MSPLSIALLGAMLAPLFIATWRTSLIGLACQGWLMAWMAWRVGPPHDAEGWITLVDLALGRGVAAPLALGWTLQERRAPARSDVIPPNLLSWTFALGLVLLAFQLSERLAEEPGARADVAVAAAGLLLGFLVLSTKTSAFSQTMGALRVENSIALLELGAPHHGSPWLAVGRVSALVWTIALLRAHLGREGRDAEPPATEAAL